jgi:hypothetical protein
MPRAKEEALAIGRTVVSYESTIDPILEAADHRGEFGGWTGPVLAIARSLVMGTVAAFAILVLLPAALAAQATVP